MLRSFFGEAVPLTKPTWEDDAYISVRIIHALFTEVEGFPSPHEYGLEDILHLCEDEQSSSISTEFWASSQWPNLCYFRSWSGVNIELSRCISWDGEFVGHRNLWGIDSEPGGKDSTNKHGSLNLDLPYEPCLHHASLESAMLSALSMHEDYDNPLLLFGQES